MGKGITKAKGVLSQCGNVTGMYSFHQSVVMKPSQPEPSPNAYASNNIGEHFVVSVIVYLIALHNINWKHIFSNEVKMNFGIYSEDIWAKIINLIFCDLMIFISYLCFRWFNTKLYIMENNLNGGEYIYVSMTLSMSKELLFCLKGFNKEQSSLESYC